MAIDWNRIKEVLIENELEGCCGCARSGFRAGIRIGVMASGALHPSKRLKLADIERQARDEANRRYEEREKQS